ncbi:methyltransferase family protein [Stackebrandtia albiflava]|uniref:Methyltransferase family protein n=1 Tax=Stackebrandtia albiflava TaxID=406432 RepID=A0A562URK9_9ACTN|nr:class I SAM-dependent methyltransferase [Stackebrandtia albiflava]TWJ08244.1 methyltransferase family protein [Stackebrandtia albiflava]
MPDAIFAHPRLAAVYDAFDGDRADLDAYRRVAAELGARRVLDIGCGTGNLAVLLTEDGLDVTGVDPAAASLAIAATKDPDGAIRWIHGDATDVPATAPGFDLAVMTGNVAQVFLTDAEWTATLRAIHATLRPGGHLVYETRRPEYRAWEEWAADTAPARRDVPGVGIVEQTRQVTDVDLPLVSFRESYRFESDGEVVDSRSTLRFRDRAESETALRDNGFEVRDVRQAPDRPGREFVFVARRVG